VTGTVRVGVVSYNTATLLPAALDALPAALDGLAAEVVVVDNASTDGSADLLTPRAGIRLVRNGENVGYARAMNVALAGGDDVLIALNPDTVAAPGSLRRLVECLLRTPDVGLVVPRLVGPDGAVQHSAHRFPTVRLALVTGFLPPRWRRGAIGRRLWLEGSAPHDRPADLDWAIGAVHVVRAIALGGAAPYDERWFMYAEDMELCWRLRRAGWRVLLEPSAQVVHIGNAAGAATWSTLAREERWLDATYDWYVSARGVSAARTWAAANVAGLLAKRAVLRGASDGDDDHVRAQRGFLLALTRLHARRVRRPQTTGLAASRP